MDVEFAGAHMIWDGVLRCTADDPGAYYAADVRRVLELFVLAAEQGLELEADTLLAAAGAAPGVRSLSGRAAGAAAQRLLLSGAPEALGVLCAAGAYASFGLPQRAPCLHGLAEAPAVPMARWWLYLRRCGTSAVRDASLCAALELDAALPELMAALDVLAARKTPPADRQELKRVLSRLPEALDYDAAARTLALADPRWNSQPALYAALRLSREPYLPAQLAVTSAELTAGMGPAGPAGRGHRRAADQLPGSAAGAGENAGRAGMSRRKCENTGNRRRKACTCDIQIV